MRKLPTNKERTLTFHPPWILTTISILPAILCTFTIITVEAGENEGGGQDQRYPTYVEGDAEFAVIDACPVVLACHDWNADSSAQGRGTFGQSCGHIVLHLPWAPCNSNSDLRERSIRVAAG